MGLEALQAIVGNFYNQAYGVAEKRINMQAKADRDNALRSFAARNMSASGSAEGEIIDKVDRNKDLSLSDVSGKLATSQAESMTSLFGQQQAYDNQVNFYNMQRKDSNNDFVRNLLVGTVGNVATMALAGPVAGAAAEAAKRATQQNIFIPDSYNPNTDENLWEVPKKANSDIEF